MKKLIALLLCLFMAVSLMACSSTEPENEPSASANQPSSSTTGDPAEGGYKIAFTSNFLGNSWRTQYEEAVKARFEEYKALGIVSEYSFLACNSDVTEQLNQLNALLEEDYDLIMIDPVSASSMTSVIETAKEKGIKVFFGNTVTPLEGTPCITANMGQYAAIEANWLVDVLDGKGKIIEMYGVAGDGTCALMEKTIREIFEGTEIETLATTNGYWNDADAQTEMATMLATYGDSIDAIFCEDGMAYGIINAYLNAGEELVPMGGDYFNSFIKYWYENQDTVNTIMIPNSPYATGSMLVDCCVYMAAGYEIDENMIGANTLDGSIKNHVNLDLPIIVLEEADGSPEWLSKFPNAQLMTIDEVYEIMKDKAETAAIEVHFDDAYIASIFGQESNPWL